MNEMMNEIEEIDYAILKSVSYGINTIIYISKILQIRTMFVERHMYRLVKEGYISFQFQYFTITSKGTDAMFSFERENLEWGSIDEFIMAKITRQKEQKFRIYKFVDKILLISIIICIILIIYFY